MGYGYYVRDGMERGYSVLDKCHADNCREEIDRGLACLCYSCLLYFCPKHLTYAEEDFDCFAGYSSQCCFKCADEAEKTESF